MSDLLTADEIAFQARMAAFVDERVAPHAAEADQRGTLAQPSWQALAERGLLGVAIPQQYGGMGATIMCAALALEEVSRVCPSTSLSLGAHSFLCAQNLYHNGSEELRQRYLPDLCSGRRAGAFALTEPGSGSDATSISTRATRDGDHYILHGSKTFITNGPFAEIFLVYARTGDSGARALSAFVVEKETPGFAVGRNLHKLGFRGSPTSELMFDNCRVPVTNRVAEEGDGIRIMMTSLDLERSLMSTIPLGMMRRALQLARQCMLAYAGRGQSHPDGQEAEGRLAEMMVGLEALRGLAYRSIRALERGQPVTVAASCAKLYGGDMINRVTASCVDMLAAERGAARQEAERLMRDARLISIGAGTSEIQKMILARECLKN
jgi:isovaleryl-CoA dehydrogenase